MKALFPLALLACLLAGLRQAAAASKPKGLDVLISADAIASPEGFRPRPGKPIHYIFFQSRQTLGEAVAGVKLPEPALVERAVVAELGKQGFVRTEVGGPLPEIAINAVVGDANFEPPRVPFGNPYEDPEFASYIDQVPIRRILDRYLLGQRVPASASAIFDGPWPSPTPEINDARDAIISEALRIAERTSGRGEDRAKINALLGATKVERAVADRTISYSEAEKIAWAAQENKLYITLSAFDVKRQADGSRTLLWRTTMLIDWRNDLSKTLPTMLALAGPMFGTDLPAPGFLNDLDPSKAKVEVGEAKVVPEGGAAAPAEKKR